MRLHVALVRKVNRDILPGAPRGLVVHDFRCARCSKIVPHGDAVWELVLMTPDTGGGGPFAWFCAACGDEAARDRRLTFDEIYRPLVENLSGAEWIEVDEVRGVVQ